MDIELGCFTRPWDAAGCALDDALAGIASAGFRTLGLAPLPADAGRTEIARLRAQVEGYSLRAQAAFGNPDLALDDAAAVARLERQIELAEAVGVQYIVVMGTAEESQYERWYSIVERCLDSAGRHNISLLLKPHGGLSALAGDLLRALERVRHPSFGICYDPGNIHYYAGQRAEDDLPKVAEYVKAMCVKDEVGGKHGEVMVTPGTGEVAFDRVFSILANAGFVGPCWMECVGGTTLEEINAEAKKARQFVLDAAAAA